MLFRSGELQGLRGAVDAAKAAMVAKVAAMHELEMAKIQAMFSRGSH